MYSFAYLYYWISVFHLPFLSAADSSLILSRVVYHFHRCRRAHISQGGPITSSDGITRIRCGPLGDRFSAHGRTVDLSLPSFFYSVPRFRIHT